ncbi:MAG: hypothetical protein MJZ20_12115 [Bacteroidaceae bacterium]|nr:hypothetical protein [Bacteroidaceae bacterium]
MKKIYITPQISDNDTTMCDTYLESVSIIDGDTIDQLVKDDNSYDEEKLFDSFDNWE